MMSTSRTSKNDDQHEDVEPWHFTVVRTQGLHFLRPERSWRPIVTVDVDGHAPFESTLGCGGENPNQKEVFVLETSGLDSKLDIRIWQKRQTKKKGAKRNLVASAAVTLNDVLKRQDPKHGLSVRLTACRTGTNVPRKGSRITAAVVVVKLRNPSNPAAWSTFSASPTESTLVDDEFEEGSSQCSSASASDMEPEPEPPAQLRKRKVRGYKICSSDESGSQSDELDECPYGFDDGTPPSYESDGPAICTPDLKRSLSPPPYSIVHSIAARLLPSIIPTHNATDDTSIASTASYASTVISSLSFYTALRDADVEADDEALERILERLRAEWMQVGGALIALATLAAAVFGFSDGTLFPIDGLARRAVAAASVSSGIGLGIDAYYLMVYQGADAPQFRRLALDVYGGFFFFALSSRVPALCMFVAALALMLFLATVAYAVWADAVTVFAAFVGLLMGLQYFVWFFHRAGMLVGRGVRGLMGRVARLRNVPSPGASPDAPIAVPHVVPPIVPPAVRTTST